LAASSARDGQLLLLAAGQVAAAAVQHLLEHREQLVQLGRDGRAAGLVGQAHAQVLLDREPREDLAALRHEADAGAGALVRRGVLDRLAVELDAADLIGTRPMSDLSSVVLPTPLRPRMTVTLPQLRLHAHVPQDVRAAVVLVDVLDVQHGAGAGQPAAKDMSVPQWDRPSRPVRQRPR
jgi:hypothetical protein